MFSTYRNKLRTMNELLERIAFLKDRLERFKYFHIDQKIIDLDLETIKNLEGQYRSRQNRLMVFLGIEKSI